MADRKPKLSYFRLDKRAVIFGRARPAFKWDEVMEWMVGKGRNQGGSSGRPPHRNKDGSRKHKPRAPSTGHARGRGIPAAARPRTEHDGWKKHKAGERLVTAAYENPTLHHGVSAEDGQGDEEEEAGSKTHKKRLIPAAVKSAIETVKRNIQVHPCVPHCPFCVPHCFIPQTTGLPNLDAKGELRCSPCSRRTPPMVSQFQTQKVRFWMPEFREGIQGKPYCPGCSEVDGHPCGEDNVRGALGHT